MITINKQKLNQLNACSYQVDLFIKTFGDVDVQNTNENIQLAVKTGLDIVWLTRKLYPEKHKSIEQPAYEQYESIEQPAYEQYESIEQPAYEQYELIQRQAWEQYESTVLAECIKILLEK